jgi:hypothetical protein
MAGKIASDDQLFCLDDEFTDARLEITDFGPPAAPPSVLLFSIEPGKDEVGSYTVELFPEQVRELIAWLQKRLDALT